MLLKATFKRSNLDGNLCPTLTAHSEPLPFSELAETGSRQIIHISIRVLGWQCGFLCWGDPKTKLGGRGTPLQTPKIDHFLGFFSGCSLFILFLGSNQHIHSPRGRGFLKSNTHYQFSIKTLFMIWWLSKERSVFNKNSTLKEKSTWSRTGLWQRLYTKK